MPAPAGEVIDLDRLITAFGQSMQLWESQPEPGVLARARFADACRLANLRPVNGLQFQDVWGPLDDGQRQRFCLFTIALDVKEVVHRLGGIGSSLAALEQLQELALRLEQLTLAVLQASDIRLEEFARHFCAKWQLAIKGEEPEASATRLHAIDFGRLMREAEAARASAADRLAYLKKLQDEQEETRRPRRGKW